MKTTPPVRDDAPPSASRGTLPVVSLAALSLEFRTSLVAEPPDPFLLSWAGCSARRSVPVVGAGGTRTAVPLVTLRQAQTGDAPGTAGRASCDIQVG